VEEIVRKLIVLFILVLVFGCNKAEHAAKLASNDAAAPISLAKSQAKPAEAAQVAAMPRMIVRTANVKIIVADTAKTVDAITQSVEAGGGYVSGSHIWRDGELLRATLTLRVPSEKLTATLAAIRGLAKRVENETIGSEDVSQEYVDLESQLRNLEATEIELRELMTTIRKNAQKADEVLVMHQQIAAIRSQIEQIKGRMRYLGSVSSMSTVSLEIAPDFIAQPVVEPGWQPVVIVKDASRALVGVGQFIATIAIWFLIYILPIVGTLLIIVALLWKFVRRHRPVIQS
jgi:hypothetical protein